MNKMLIALFVGISLSANAMDVPQANEEVAHAERNYSAAVGSYNNAAHQLGSGVNSSSYESQLNDAAAARAQAYADQRSAIQNQQSQAIRNYGVKTNSEGNPVSMVAGVKNDPTGNPVNMVVGVKNDPTGLPVSMVAGTKVNPTGHNVINVAASTLSPSTKVITDKGVVTAATLPKNAQVTVQFDSAFNKSVKGSNGHATGGSHSEHGTGNGANNAANSHSSHGLGGSESIGGGHSGGGFHY